MQKESLQLPNTAQSTWGENVLGLKILAEWVLVMQTTHGFGFAILGAGIVEIVRSNYCLNYWE